MSTKLTAENVEAVFLDCLFKDGEDTSNPAIGEGVISNFGFNRERLETHETEIETLLCGLPDEFQADKGGGWSFLNACMTKEGEQWGEHRNIEQLLALGIASGRAKMLMPRVMWKMMPGGMPYFSVVRRSAGAGVCDGNGESKSGAGSQNGRLSNGGQP